MRNLAGIAILAAGAARKSALARSLTAHGALPAVAGAALLPGVLGMPFWAYLAPVVAFGLLMLVVFFPVGLATL